MNTLAKTALTECERIIERGLTNFVEVGNALLKIRDERLYQLEFKTFEAYCRERWGMVASRARQLISAAEICENIKSVTAVTLATERQARPLAKLPPEKQAQAWKAAIESAPNGKVTTKHIETIVAENKSDNWEFNKTQTPKATDPSDFDSDALFHLKRQWRKATKKDRKAFLQWIGEGEQ